MEFLNRPASNFGTSAWLCGLIQCLRQPDPLLACIAHTQPEIGITTQRRVFPADANYPAFVAFVADDLTVVAIDGASRVEHLQKLVDGYSGGLLSGFGDPTNAYLEEAAASILTKLAASGLVTTQKWVLAGYSLGGAIAPYLRVNTVIKPWFASSIETVTFGAPRSGGVSWQRFINANMNLTRWMTPLDPIPLCPPRTADFPPLPAIIGVRPALRWQNYCHAAGGVEIDAFGVTNRTAIPTGAACNMVASLAQWMWGVLGDNRSEHALDVYRIRLQVAARDARGHTRPDVAPPEPRGQEARAELNRAERRAQEALVAIEQGQNQQTENIPKVARFNHEKIGKFHYVTFRGTVVSTTTSKRKAMGVAREMNSALFRLQRMAIVDTDAFAKEFAQYLDEASDPAGEFSPVMRTDWNVGAIP